MLTESIARRYAKALFDAAVEEKKPDLIKDELKEFIATLDWESRLKAIWNSGRMPNENKKQFVQKSFPNLSFLVHNFLFVLIDKRREKILWSVLQEYETFLLEFYNQVFVQVKSAVAVPAPIQSELKERLSKKLGKRVELLTSEDPSLIGGMVIQIGDRIIDGSIRAKLEGLREELLSKA